MAGHSKWANIKHRKARVDAKRAKVWSKLASNIIQAARSGGDPDKNHRLAFTIAEARKENMPVANIERAIKRGTGEIEGADPEELLYEGYAHGGTAIIIEALTDNRKRTAGDVRTVFNKKGGRMGTPGSVGFMFQSKGQIFIDPSVTDEDAVMNAALEAGAADVQEPSG
ncbi:MAG: YebC/PmpR family DNA-binding transcriptional regulator, partial [Planctomycetes bacterium]|nr:YebC/PmpR family DNA-binding transcriptional regulator [Planctomycetota bacterium]